MGLDGEVRLTEDDLYYFNYHKLMTNVYSELIIEFRRELKLKIKDEELVSDLVRIYFLNVLLGEQ